MLIQDSGSKVGEGRVSDSMNDHPFRLGIIVNPYAGVGGPEGWKGSDDEEIQRRAKAGELVLRATFRAETFLRHLQSLISGRESLEVFSVQGNMGVNPGWSLNFPVTMIDAEFPKQTFAQHTQKAVTLLCDHNLDLLVFVGGDGTARDVCSVVSTSQPVLGVPSGVKMHSGVFAVNPQSAAELISRWIKGELIAVEQQEVRDIDEEAFRRGVVKSQFYGEMLTPQLGQYVQHVKQGGFEVEELVLLDIADDLVERIPANSLVVWGPGSTTLNIAKNWGVETTLLGVDLLLDQQCIARDVDAETIITAIEGHKGGVYIVVTAIGGQGHIFGRGNQQITAEVMAKVGKSCVVIVATKTKLKSLQGRPLLIDSGDPEVDKLWAGYLPVVCGYQDVVVYAVGGC